MILNNFYAYYSYMSSHALGVGSWIENVDIGMKGLNGSTVGVVTGVFTDSQIMGYGFMNWVLKNGLAPVVGSGTSEPTLTDYNLQNDITNSFSNYAYTVNVSFESGKVKTVLTISGTNTSGNDLTISEVGIKKKIISSSQLDGKKDVLLIRHVLETPKTVASGDGFSLAFEWTEQ